MIIRFFVANISKELELVEPLIKELKLLNPENLILQEKISSSDWKVNVEKKIQNCDFFVVMIGQDTLKNSNIRWEIQQALKEGIPIYGLKLSNFKNTEEVKKFNYEYPLFENCEAFNNFIKSEIIEIRKISLESYKIFVSSTEKVTDQRSKIHTLFFTLLASLMTLSFLIARNMNFNIPGMIAIIFIILVALFLVYSWEKLVNSYGTLNKGKFEIIYKLEKQLRINHFEKEWDILRNKLNYQSTTVVEKQLINIFRIFLSSILLFALVYLYYLAYKK
ncbi:TPA: TIR domain-containing protein [Acinetobacter baumannii]